MLDALFLHLQLWPTLCICVFVCICICVFVYLCTCVFVYLCILHCAWCAFLAVATLSCIDSTHQLITEWPMIEKKANHCKWKVIKSILWPAPDMYFLFQFMFSKNLKTSQGQTAPFKSQYVAFLAISFILAYIRFFSTDIEQVLNKDCVNGYPDNE